MNDQDPKSLVELLLSGESTLTAEARARVNAQVEQRRATTHEFGTDKGQQFILCLVCKRRSFSPGDIGHRYCGHCHKFHPIIKDPE